MRERPGHTRGKRRRKPPRPLDRERLEELALTYVARYATSTAKLEGYLARKLRERGWSEDEPAPPDVTGIVTRHVEAGHIDDAAYARTRAGSLLRRGYGNRRVEQTLYADGIEEEVRGQVRAGTARSREAAVALARRRRFGPFHRGAMDERARERQIAAILRAGHDFDAARTIVSAETEVRLEEWIEEAIEQ